MDHLIVLTAEQRLAKRIRLRDGQPPEVEGYDNAAVYEWHARPVAGLWDLAGELESIGSDPHSCVIRGQLREHAKASRRVNRCVHPQADGRQPDWEPATPGRRWVAFDLDKVKLPKRLQPGRGGMSTDVVRGMVRHVRASLPEPFSGASCVYRLSASAGLSGWPEVSMHLWFWLSRPVYDLSWRAWAQGRPVDPAFFRAVQPHYTAAPVFVGGKDPLAGLRFGVLEDGPTEVQVPAELHDAQGWHEAEAQRLDQEREAREAKRQAIVGALSEQKPSAARAYALRALAGAVGDVLGAPVGNRHGTLVTKCYKVGGYVQDGFLSAEEVTHAFGEAVKVVFPAQRHKEELRAVREMVEAGSRSPVDLSHVGRPAKRPEPEAPRARHDAPQAAAKGPPKGKAATEPQEPGKGPKWASTRDDGTPTANRANVEVLLRHHGFELRHNVMSRSDEWAAEGMVVPADIKRSAIMARIRNIARGYGMPAAEQLRDSLVEIQAASAYHPVADWIRSRPWDGTDRFGALFNTLHVREEARQDRPLFDAMLRAWLIAGARCALLPLDAETGIDSHGVLVLQGPQGCGKTKWLQALVPEGVDWMKDGISVNPSDKDDVARATRHWLVELGELDATIRKSDIAALKSFLTSSKDSYRRPYAQEVEIFARRTFFAATVNPRSFLADDSGNRRFWVVPVETCLWRPEDRQGLDMQQVWAQAAAHAAAGVPHVLPPELVDAQARAVESHRAVDPWQEAIEATFERCDPAESTASWMTTNEVYRRLGLDEQHMQHREKVAIARALSAWGAIQVRERRGSLVVRLWSVRVPGFREPDSHKPLWA